MRLTTEQLRQIIKEELNELFVLRPPVELEQRPDDW